MTPALLLTLSMAHAAYPEDLPAPPPPTDAESVADARPSAPQPPEAPPPADAPEARAEIVEEDGATWVVITETRRVPLAAPLARADAGPTAHGAVLRARAGVVVVDAGLESGLREGMDVEVVGTTEVEVPALVGRGTEERQVERVVATGRVSVVEPDRALVELDRGGHVSPADRVQSATDRPRYPLAPERLGGVAELGLALRPVLALDTLGVAFVNEAWARYGFDAPWYVAARVSPMGLGWSRDGNPLSAAALGSGGYDHRSFGVGLGLGWSMLNADPTRGAFLAQADEGIQPGFTDVRSAFAVVQEARLGATDGLHLTVRNTFLLVPRYRNTWTEDCATAAAPYGCERREEDGQEFAYGGFGLRAQVPTGGRTDLVGDFGTGDAGAVWAQGGVHTWLRGNGDAGSFGVEVSAGYGSLTGRPDDERVSLYGPMVGVGGRLRL